MGESESTCMSYPATRYHKMGDEYEISYTLINNYRDNYDHSLIEIERRLETFLIGKVLKVLL